MPHPNHECLGRPGRTCRFVELTCEYDCDAIASEGDGESQGESVSAIACSGLGLSDAAALENDTWRRPGRRGEGVRG